jgi:hypothetical protein
MRVSYRYCLNLGNLQKRKIGLDFQPGFWLSETAVGYLMLGVCAAVLLARWDERLGLAVLFVLNMEGGSV